MSRGRVGAAVEVGSRLEYGGSRMVVEEGLAGVGVEGVAYLTRDVADCTARAGGTPGARTGAEADGF